MAYSVMLKTGGYVEFKYRKDSKSTGFLVNGEFKFAVNNKEVLVDYKTTNASDWQVYKYQFPGAGMYTLAWIYTKYSEQGSTENMAAEIEYVRVTGMEYSPKTCHPCKSG